MPHHLNVRHRKNMKATRLLIVGQFFLLTTLLITGCSKMTAEEVKIRQDFSSIPPDMPVKNLGEIQFISGTPKNIKLDDEQTLMITATAQKDETIQIILEYESTKRKVGSLIKESYSERRQFLLKPGMRCAPKLGDHIAVVFSPKFIKSEAEILP